MELPAYIVFQVSPDAATSLRPGPHGAPYARVNVRQLIAFAGLREEILRQMHIKASRVDRIEYHRPGCNDVRSLDDLYYDDHVLKGLASRESVDWTLYLNIVGDERGHAMDGQLPVEVNVRFYRAEWCADSQHWSADPEAWGAGSLECEADERVSDLSERLAHVLLSKAQHRSEYAESLARGTSCLQYASGMLSAGGIISLDDNHLRVAKVSDLFENPTSASNTIDAVVMFRRVEVPIRAASARISPVMPRRIRHFYRLGNLADDKKKAIRSTSRQEGADPSRPHSDHVLLAYREEKACGDKWGLLSTHVYNFGEYCVGDVENFVDRLFHTKHDYYPPFERLKESGSLAVVQALIEEGTEEDGRMEVGPGVPFLPTFCFNELNDQNAEVLGLGVDARSWSQDDHIDLAVRCSSHLTGSWDFPYDIAIERATMTTTATKVRALIEDIIKAQVPSGKKKNRYAAKLFEEGRRESWRMQLWIMAQAPSSDASQRKLYLWSQDDDDAGELLSVFMNQELWDQGERRLYVEAHIVPSREANIITGSFLQWELGK